MPSVLRVVAEGVENPAQLAVLSALGCDLGQAFSGWGRRCSKTSLRGAGAGRNGSRASKTSVRLLGFPLAGEESPGMASYSVNPDGVTRARGLIEARQYVLDSGWGEIQPTADDENAYLKSHSWDEYGAWHLGLTHGGNEETKARYAFVYGDFRRIHRMGLIACLYRAAEWRHKEVELAAHDLLQRLDASTA